MPSPEEQFPALAADAAANPKSSSARLLKTMNAAEEAIDDLGNERKDTVKSSGEE
jgi:hypothetical protein